MRIILNGMPAEVEGAAQLESVVLSLGRGTKGMAAAVNGEMIPRSRWAGHSLVTGDRVEILGAAPGG